MAKPEGIEIEGARTLEPNRRGRRLSLGFSALVAIAGGAAIAKLGLPAGKDGASFVNVLVLGILGGLVSAWYFHNFARKLSKVAHRLRAAAEGVFLDEDRVVPRAEIKSAVILPSKTGGAVIRIERRGFLRGVVDYAVPRLEDARAFVKALGHGGAQTARSFTVAAPSRKHFRKRLYALWASIPAAVGLVVAGKTLFGPGAATGVLALVGVLTVLMLLGLFLKRAEVTVGADGVRVGWLWQKSFIPIDDIERAEAVAGDANVMGYFPIYVRIHRRAGPPIDVLSQLGRTMPFSSLDGKWREYAMMSAGAVAERINEAVAGGSRAGGAADLASWESELLSRGERAIGTWVKALRGIHTEIESFRKQAGGGLDALWGVLEDAGATPERRAAAAVALSPHLDDSGRARVRIAAQAVAAPKLRIALEAAADADDDALASALEEVSEEPPPKVARVT